MMLTSSLPYTTSDIFLAGVLFYIPISLATLLIGILVDRLKKWGNFSLFLIIINLITSVGMMYTCNVNKVLFFTFVCAYSLTSGTIATGCLALTNVLLDKMNIDDELDTPHSVVESETNGNSDEVNTIFNWVSSLSNALLLLVGTYVNLSALNWVMLAETAISSAIGVWLLLHMPGRANV